MILPDFVLLSRVNCEEKFTGMDCEEFCESPRLFAQYPHPIVYKYNSRGFRDAEWPDDLTSAIWCVGDSFTVGVGCPHSHTWPSVLQRKTHTRCINVSLDGASNQWIARKIVSLTQSLAPKCLVVHWSYIHRRESNSSLLTKTMNSHWVNFYNKIKDPTWPQYLSLDEFDQLPEYIQKEILEIHAGAAEHALLTHRLILDDESRRLYFDPLCNEQADVEDTIDCVNKVQGLGINVIHSFVPGFAAKSAATHIIKHLDQLGCRYVVPFNRLDVARDGHHYGAATAEFFTDQIINLI
jgi:hypothetical protein